MVGFMSSSTLNSQSQVSAFRFPLSSPQKKRVTMVYFFHLFFLCFLGLTGAGQESFELLNLYDPTLDVLQPLSQSLPVAVAVNNENLGEVSSSIIMAESWLRTHVLAHYPATKISTIVVGDALLCNKGQEHNLGLVLPSLKNFYHSLTRWGLEKEIKVSPTFSPNCLHKDTALYRDDLGEKIFKPLQSFLQSTNSSFSLSPPPNFSDKNVNLMLSHSELLKKMRFLGLNKVNVMLTNPRLTKFMGRKLSLLDSKLVKPLPARPTPLPNILPSPLHSSIGNSAPANVAKNPLPPLAEIPSPPPISQFHTASPPMSLPFAPELPPVFDPASPPFGFNLPPCNPVHAGAPPPVGMGRVVQRLWCVAKPSVPADTLQEAMDYACGEGRADCEEIMPQGSCYHPDTVVAHASYAFNSYWQKNKRNGGTCSFGGTAMVINADPSFLHCRFVLT